MKNEKETTAFAIVSFWLWATKKDILGSFAYEFELLQKMKFVQARMKSAMQMKSSAMPQMKLNPPIRRRGGFHSTKVDFIVEDDFTHPQGWI